MANKIRICERDNNHFEIVIIDDVRTYNQGPAHEATTPKQAYDWALRTLPARVLEGATWELRSEAGVYTTLDMADLGVALAVVTKQPK